MFISRFVAYKFIYSKNCYNEKTISAIFCKWRCAVSNVQLTDNLVRLRKAYNYTQQQIGDKLNISRQAYSNYERGKRIPDIGMLIRLADIYGVSLEQLLTQTCTKDGVLNESHGPYYRGMVIENADTLYLTREELDLLTHYRKAEADDRRLVQKVLGMDLPG